MKMKFYNDVKKYSIKQAAALTGINEKTLRYYDELHLLTPLYRNAKSKYRYYTIKQFYQIENLQLAKRFGLSMKDYTSLQVKGFEIAQGEFQESDSAYEQVIKNHRLQIEQLEAQIAIMEQFRQNLGHFQEYLATGQHYRTKLEDMCLLVTPMDPSGNFEDTSHKARALSHDPRYQNFLTPYWGVLLDTSALRQGRHKVSFQYCRLNTFIKDENTLLIKGGSFDTLISRAWIDEDTEKLSRFLTSHPCADPYVMAEELAVFDEVDNIHHQIFFRCS